jgi:predicted permease
MFTRFRSLINGLTRRDRFERTMREEMRFHIDARTDDLEVTGLSRTEARRRAHLEFGTVDAVKDDCREARGLRPFDTLSQDLGYALRIMGKAPGFTAAAVLSLALGIGANTAIFTLIDAALLRTLPVGNPHELYFLAHGRGIRASTMSNYPLLEHYGSATVFSGIAAYDGPQTLKVSGPTGVELVPGQFVTRNYHSVVAVPFALGRGFVPGPDRNDEGTYDAVISHAYWQRRFGGDPQVLGKTFTVDRRVVTIVGVTSAQFSGLVPGTPIDVTLPLSLKAIDRPEFFDQHDNWTSMPIVGRVKAGVSTEEARVATDVLFQQYMAQPENAWIRTRAPETYAAAELLPADKGASSLRRQYAQALWILMAIVGVVLLVACANVANLLLARSAARAREVAIRLCVGGTRWRIVRQFLTESLLLAIVGGTGGVLIATWGTRAVLALLTAGENPVVLGVAPNARVLAFTMAVSMLTGVAFGMLPALKATAIDLTPSLKDTARTTAVRRRWNIGSLLVGVQVALCAVVITIAGLLVQTLHNIKTQPTGFAQTHVLLFALDDLGPGFARERVANVASDVIARLERIRGVASAAASTSTPVHTSGNARVMQVPGAPPSTEERTAWTNLVTPSYFRTLGIGLVRGRLLTDHDTAGTPPVALINETFAREYFPGVDPVGRQIGLGAEPPFQTQIVGVVRDAHQTSLREAPPRMIYTPIAQSDEPPSRFTVAVRIVEQPTLLAAEIRTAVQSLDPDFVIHYMRTMEQQIDASLVRERLLATLSTSFGLLALILSAIGLYGVMAYDVTRRAREIGIRIALGARRGWVLRHVLRGAVIVASAGIAAGIAVALVATRVLATFVFGLSPRDPSTLVGVSIFLLATTMAAAWIPARRAARLDPMQVIKFE